MSLDTKLLKDGYQIGTMDRFHRSRNELSSTHYRDPTFTVRGNRSVRGWNHTDGQKG
jgi:hypothetical protein